MLEEYQFASLSMWHSFSDFLNMNQGQLCDLKTVILCTSHEIVCHAITCHPRSSLDGEQYTGDTGYHDVPPFSEEALQRPL